jgi:hypothetical protein
MQGSSAEALALVEARVGRPLPAAFRSLLLEQDGGDSAYLAYHVGERYVALPTFLAASRIVASLDEAATAGTPVGVVVIARSDQAWLGLDYRSGDAPEPAVVHGASAEAPVEVVAASFDALLAGLVVEVAGLWDDVTASPHGAPVTTTRDESRPFWLRRGPHGASPDAIAAAEARMGVQLPAAFKDLLLRQDGGVSRHGAYCVGERSVPLPGFFHVATLVSSFEAADAFGTPRGIVAIASGGHDWLGLDYRSGGAPSVVYQVSEDGELEVVAASFEDFLAGLV